VAPVGILSTQRLRVKLQDAIYAAAPGSGLNESVGLLPGAQRVPQNADYDGSLAEWVKRTDEWAIGMLRAIPLSDPDASNDWSIEIERKRLARELDPTSRAKMQVATSAPRDANGHPLHVDDVEAEEF
jgi:hypothetical protein